MSQEDTIQISYGQHTATLLRGVIKKLNLEFTNNGLRRVNRVANSSHPTKEEGDWVELKLYKTIKSLDEATKKDILYNTNSGFSIALTSWWEKHN